MKQQLREFLTAFKDWWEVRPRLARCEYCGRKVWWCYYWGKCLCSHECAACEWEYEALYGEENGLPF